MGLADEGTQGVRLAQPAKAGDWKGHDKGSLAALSRVLTQRRKEVPRDANMDQAHPLVRRFKSSYIIGTRKTWSDIECKKSGCWRYQASLCSQF